MEDSKQTSKDLKHEPQTYKKVANLNSEGVSQNNKIKRKIYYTILILNLSIVQSYTAINDTLVGPIFPTIKKDLNWNESNENILLSISQSIPILGFVISSYSNPLFTKIKPNRLISITKIVYILALVLTLFNNTVLFITGRFISGLALGYQLPACYATLYNATYPTHRSRSGTVPNMMFSFGLIVSLYLGSLVSQNSISRTFYYSAIICFAFLDFICFVFILKLDKNPFYFVLKGEEKSAKNLLSHYMTEQATVEMINLLNEGKSVVDKQKGKKVSFFKENKPEIKYSIIYAISVHICCFAVFSPYAMLMATEDLENGDEVSRTGRYLTLAGIAELTMKIFSIIFNLNKKRKKVMLIAALYLVFMHVLQGIFVLSDLWEYAKIMVIFIFIGIGMYSNCYFAQLPEYFPHAMVGIAHSNSLVLWFLGGIVFPILDLKRDGNRILHWGSFGFAFLHFLSFLLVMVFSFETDGLSRKNVYERLRGVKNE